MKVRNDLIHRNIAGDHILIPVGEFALQYNGVFVISELGAGIWELLREGKEPEEIINILLEEYDVTEDILRKDMEEFLHMLREKTLILE